MVGPTPRQEHVDIQKIPHGKSDSISRTASVVSGEAPAGAAKISAPVNLQRTLPADPPAGFPAARLRRYADKLSRSRRANCRIRCASSSVTLKLIVFMGNTVIPGDLPDKGNFPEEIAWRKANPAVENYTIPPHLQECLFTSNHGSCKHPINEKSQSAVKLFPVIR